MNSRNKPILIDPAIKAEAITAYEGGQSALQLAATYNCSPAYVAKLLKEHGVKVRSSAEQGAIGASIYQNREEIINRYRAGESLKSICRSLRVHHNQASDLLTAEGIEIRKGPNKHGLRYTPEYKTWKDIRKRCFSPGATNYRYYGGRGITMCNELANSPQYFVDTIGPKPGNGYCVDRINNEGHYSCGKCPQCLQNKWSLNIRWITHKQNCRNTRSNTKIEFRGKTKCVTEWAEDTGITSLAYRLKSGWSVEDALTKPVDTAANQPTAISEENRTRMIELYTAGMSMIKVAKQVGCSTDAVRNALTRNGMHVRTQSEQQALDGNRHSHLITHNGKTQNIASWSRELGIASNTLSKRLRQGWSVEKSLTTPVQ